MTPQFRNVERGCIVWRDYRVEGEVAKPPVDIDALLPGGLAVGTSQRDRDKKRHVKDRFAPSGGTSTPSITYSRSRPTAARRLCPGLKILFVFQ